MVSKTQGMSICPPQLDAYFMDHVVENEATQDSISVMSNIAAVFVKISHIAQNIKEVTIHTDNATTYQNGLIYVLVPCIPRKYGIKIRNILHADVQRGKFVSDATFAYPM